ENDLDMEELKELVKRQAQLNADTNKVVHSMRRSQRLRSVWSVVWWLLILGVSAWSYYTYVQPYVTQIMGAYGKTQNFESQVQGFFGQYFGTSTKPK
ncbi:MAG TPA: hypothetical protein VGP13_01075, partial [Candidatus Paceibacterota bacterium]|nr:hypothetical protein [Candidatus Paceibacterota bacterium]